jgi:hypothetical protein
MRARAVTERPRRRSLSASVTHDLLVGCLAAILRAHEQQFDDLLEELSASYPPDEVGERLVLQCLATYGM